MSQLAQEDVRFFDLLFQPWIGAADDDDLMRQFEERQPGLAEIERYLQRWIAPHFRAAEVGVRQRLLKWIRHASDFDSCQFVRLWESALPPFDLPNDVGSFIALTESVLNDAVAEVDHVPTVATAGQ